MNAKEVVRAKYPEAQARRREGMPEDSAPHLYRKRRGGSSPAPTGTTWNWGTARAKKRRGRTQPVGLTDDTHPDGRNGTGRDPYSARGRTPMVEQNGPSKRTCPACGSGEYHFRGWRKV